MKMKKYCECCGSDKDLIQSKAIKRDRVTEFEMIVCKGCYDDYVKNRF